MHETETMVKDGVTKLEEFADLFRLHDLTYPWAPSEHVYERGRAERRALIEAACDWQLPRADVLVIAEMAARRSGMEERDVLGYVRAFGDALDAGVYR